jgi:FkbM family methyltransferase
VYFALQGAKQVIALEPHPPNFALAQENIRQMGLEDRITLFPAALSTTDGQAFLQVAPTEPDANSLTPPDSPLQKLISYTEKTPVQTISFSTLCAQYGLEEVDFIKLDCEGCEFALISSLPEDELRRAKTWHIEYHARPEPLIQRLQKAGFIVEKKLDRGVLGYLIARRQVNNP